MILRELLNTLKFVPEMAIPESLKKKKKKNPTISVLVINQIDALIFKSIFGINFIPNINLRISASS